MSSTESKAYKTSEGGGGHQETEQAPRSKPEEAAEPANKTRAPPGPPTAEKGLRFWAIIVAIVFAGVLTALEGTITSTSLPTIIAELDGGDNYVWAANGYFLAMTVLQPLVGQLANVFGRRWPTILSTVAFIFGSGICGGASGMAMLIVGRVIQGIGAGGINVLLEILVCDLVPLRERGSYLGLIFGLIALGTALGPFFGGLIVEHSSWRWVFYINLPIGGASLAMLVAFLNVNYDKNKSIADRLTQIDWLGNALFVAAATSTLIPLAWASSVYPWSSYQVIVPLVLGIVGMIGFFFLEASPRLAPCPMMPLHLVSNRTSATVFVLTFFHSVVTMWPIYFLPVYFQGVLGSTTSRSGVQLLPTILSLVPFAGLGGTLLSRFGRYKPLHFVGFGIAIVGFGLFTMLDANSNAGAWVGFQIILSAGAGFVIPTLLPALMAPLSDNDTALATASWSFWRSFGMMWGIALPAAVFNNRFDQIAGAQIGDPRIVSALTGGRAYEHATVAIAFAAFGFLIIALEKEIPLRTELETNEFGMVDQGEKEKGANKSDDSTVAEKGLATPLKPIPEVGTAVVAP